MPVQPRGSGTPQTVVLVGRPGTPEAWWAPAQVTPAGRTIITSDRRNEARHAELEAFVARVDLAMPHFVAREQAPARQAGAGANRMSRIDELIAELRRIAKLELARAQAA
jgi:hypothetical protein